MRKFLFCFVCASLLLSHMSYAQSLWQAREEMGRTSFFVDRRAYRVGDILTVLIEEKSSAEVVANTKTERDSTIKDEVKSWIKVILNGLGILPDIKAITTAASNLPKIETDASHEYESKGKSTRGQKLTAQITVKIVEILPNGNFVVEGSRQVTVNGENQMITLVGEVRPEDISSDNTILSSKIANAQIFCKGKGVIGDKHKKGILEWLFDIAWLF